MVHISLSSSVKVEASLWIEPLADHFVIDEHQRRVIFLDECVAPTTVVLSDTCRPLEADNKVDPPKPNLTERSVRRGQKWATSFKTPNFIQKSNNTSIGLGGKNYLYEST